MNRLLRSPLFWGPFGVSIVLLSVLFGWELGLLTNLFPSLSRPPATGADIFFTILLGLLLSIATGMAAWNMKYGSCPTGVKSATGIAGILGAVTLICPVCIVLPASLLGFGFVLAFLAPWLPLLRVIAIVLLGVSIWMLTPRR